MDEEIYLETFSKPEEYQPKFTKSELLFSTDSNNGDYSAGQLIFETNILSNSGRFQSWRNGWIDIPMQIKVSSTAGGFDTTNDLLIAIKQSNYSFINSLQITSNSSTVFQTTENISEYIHFYLNTEQNQDVVNVNSKTINYTKSTGEAWGFDASGGLYNNFHSVGHNILELENKGLYENNNFINLDSNDKKNLYAGITAKDMIEAGYNIIQNSADSKTYSFNCILRLRDMPFFKDVDTILRGAVFKIQLNLNIGNFTINKATNGKITLSSQNLKGYKNPLVFSDGSKSVLMPPVDASGAEVDEPVLEIIDGVATTIEPNKNYVVEISVCGNNTSRNKCRLYVPSLTMQADIEQQYLSLPVRKITYKDLYYKVLSNKNGNVSEVIVNAQARLTKLIIIPVLSTSSNAGINQLLSPFYASPCAPILIKNLNLKVSGVNLYAQDVEYGYEQFLTEMQSLSLNGNMNPHLTSSLISQRDYMETYKYLLFDLTRKSKEEAMNSHSLEVKMTIMGTKSYDLMCIVEYERDIFYNLQTGGMSF